MPSINACGSLSISFRFIYAPGSPSSALQIINFLSVSTFFIISHLMPVGKPAPPRPRSFAFLISSSTASGVICVSALSSEPYPPRAIYSSISSGSMRPASRRTIFFCPLKNGISFQTGTPGSPMPNSSFAVRQSHFSILHSAFFTGIMPLSRLLTIPSASFGVILCKIKRGIPGR